MYLRLNVGEYLHNKHIPTASTQNKIIIHQVSTTLPSLYFPLLRVPLTVFLTGAHACAGVSCFHVKLKARVIHRRSATWLLTRKLCSCQNELTAAELCCWTVGWCLAELT